MIGFALRQGIFSPQEIEDSARVLDSSGKVSHIFVPDGRTGYESLEISSIILAKTRQTLAGSGVIRLLEHDPLLLARRVQTLQAFSANRFILGVGTGSPGDRPGKSVVAMLARLDELHKSFRGFRDGVRPPKIFVAALKPRIAWKSARNTDGLLLNFCSPAHVSSIKSMLHIHRVNNVELACYLKIFYSSKDDETARRMMLQEFLNYDSAPQYHEMFQQDGTANSIQEFRKNDEWKSRPFQLPEELQRVSLANPRTDELQNYVRSFLQVGVTIPVPYPYFSADEQAKFKQRTIIDILDSS